jgi:small subunit ribosomal protein S1
MLPRQVSKYNDADDEGLVPDEGWWAAVLADEDFQNGTQKEIHNKNNSTAPLGVINWEYIRGLFDNDEIVALKVYGYNRGGVLVEGENLQGFVPVSHLINLTPSLGEEERRLALAGYVGRQLKLKVIECEPEEDRVVLSERAALAGKGQRHLLFNSLKSGDKVKGCVTNVTDFGVFVDLGGLEGLIHVSEISWGRVQHPTEVVQVGQVVNALVLQVFEETGRVALSMKRLMSNPWETITNRHCPGDVVPAVITSIARFGIFARLEEGVEGLIHISSMSLPEGQSGLIKRFHPGQSIKVQILHIDATKRRLGLNLINNDQEE